MSSKTEEGPRARAKRLDPAARRQALLGHGIEAFTTEPYERVAVADIAAAAGVSEGLIFRYFGDKRSFYVEALHAAVVAGMDDSYAPHDAPAPERFRASLGAYFDFARKNPEAVSFVAAGSFDPSREVRRTVDRILDDATARLLERMGVPEPGAELRSRARHWVVLTQLTAASWAQRRRRDKQGEIEMLIVSFRALVAQLLPREAMASLP